MSEHHFCCVPPPVPADAALTPRERLLNAMGRTIESDAFPAVGCILTVLQPDITEVPLTETETAAFADIKTLVVQSIPPRDKCEEQIDAAALMSFIEGYIAKIDVAGKAMGVQLAKLNKKGPIYDHLFMAMSAWSAYSDALKWAVKQCCTETGVAAKPAEVVPAAAVRDCTNTE